MPLDQPKPTRATHVWVSDIAYLPLASGDWAYLCTYQDMGSKQVVGWHALATMPEELITSALQRTLWAQPPTPALLVHSNRGGPMPKPASPTILTTTITSACTPVSTTRRPIILPNSFFTLVP